MIMKRKDSEQRPDEIEKCKRSRGQEALYLNPEQIEILKQHFFGSEEKVKYSTNNSIPY